MRVKTVIKIGQNRLKINIDIKMNDEGFFCFVLTYNNKSICGIKNNRHKRKYTKMLINVCLISFFLSHRETCSSHAAAL